MRKCLLINHFLGSWTPAIFFIKLLFFYTDNVKDDEHAHKLDEKHWLSRKFSNSFRQFGSNTTRGQTLTPSTMTILHNQQSFELSQQSSMYSNLISQGFYREIKKKISDFPFFKYLNFFFRKKSLKNFSLMKSNASQERVGNWILQQCFVLRQLKKSSFKHLTIKKRHLHIK